MLADLALLAGVVVLVFVVPWLRGYRERKLAERLERTRDPQEAAMLVGHGVRQNGQEAETVETVRKTLGLGPP